MTLLRLRPSIGYTITPIYNHQGTAVALRVQVVLTNTHVLAENVLFRVPSVIAAVDVGHVVHKRIHASDGQGTLCLVHDTKETDKTGTILWQSWRPVRSTKGTIRADYTALPRRVNLSTGNGPPFDLRENFGGLVSSGYGFLATLPDDSSQIYNVSVSWNLDGAPKGVRAIWSFGEGPEPITRPMRCSEIQATYIAVGEVKSVGDASFGIYWLGNPPFDVAKLSASLREVFFYMAALFEDEKDRYSVFIRYNAYFGTQAGTALNRSFMFSYDDGDFANPPSHIEQMLFLSHETTHNWVKFSHPGLATWYAEGMAEYYSIFTPLRTGRLSVERFRGILNGRLLAYYTNPLMSKSNDEIAELAWKDASAQLIPYGRGLIFAMRVDAMIAAESGARSIDDLILRLVRRYRNGEEVTRNEYASELSRLLGDSEESQLRARQALHDMSTGKLLVPPSQGLLHLGLQCQRYYAPVWELGFNASRNGRGHLLVTDVDKDSAAAKAGLLEGDRILNTLNLATLRRRDKANANLTVQRPPGNLGSEVEISFRPRGREMMEAWRYVWKES
ncbi:peptidase M61 domain-containing protein [Beauveria brongniartii RCEF 3172]|uniref:Peptidase M61 domain-containing protein n=1 Tax=Beauveria brongniartii RCEF 3172 TaxID=1081107 RepID=A0A166XS46_9HYPO|nr:peptidase M61 domain-containing protein [Beauveria brongniartii RCEF 3172]